jgi:type II secretory ATPase GspE/PulE/Tfp pilus assembly ATPase PilB-like protein
MAQRLIRVLCKHCKTIAAPEEHDHKFLALTGIKPEEAIGKVHKAVGCAECNNTGYRGRKAIFEMMIMNAHIRDLAFNLAPISEIRAAALAGGMRPLVEDGKLKILNGVTTPEEIASTTQTDQSKQH